jgi:hypothetical protein
VSVGLYREAVTELSPGVCRIYREAVTELSPGVCRIYREAVTELSPGFSLGCVLTTRARSEGPEESKTKGSLVHTIQCPE